MALSSWAAVSEISDNTRMKCSYTGTVRAQPLFKWRNTIGPVIL